MTCRLHVQAMDKVFASYDMLVSMSRHSDVIISYADGFLVGSPLGSLRHCLCK